MQRTKLVLVAALALLAGLLVGSVEGQSERAATSVDYDAVAKSVVHEAARIREGDRVLISGSPRDLELLEDLAVHVRMLGAFPLVTLDTDRMTRRMYDDVPAKYDKQAPDFTLELTKLITAFINVDSNDDPALLAHVPADRLAARGEAAAPIGELARKRNLRNLNIGNGLYPTAAQAELFGVPQEELARIFWGGVSVDYAQLEAAGEAVRGRLAAGREVRITNPNGTDLKVRIEGRPVFVSDGVISAEDEERGGAATQVWLPAGEVYVTPVPGTAEGTVVVERDVFQGQQIRNLRVSLEGGKVTSMSADSGLEEFQRLYDATGAGKDEFAYVDVGINPAVAAPPGSRMTAYMPAGMVTVGIGGNTWAGGENDVPFGTAWFLPGSTLEVDGEVIVEAGKLKL